MQEFSSTIASHIRFLLQSLNDSNSDNDNVLRELCQLTEHGLEGSLLTLESCLDYINLYGTEGKNIHLHPVISSVFRYIMDKSNFSTILCQSLNKNATIRDGFLGDLCNALGLSLCEKIAVGLAFSESENSDARLIGTNFCMNQIEELFANPSPAESTEQIQDIFMFLHRCEGLSKHVDTFTQMLSLMQLKEDVQLILAPLLPADLNETKFLRNMDLFYDSSEDDFDAIVAEMEKEISMADVMKELGYGCTTSASKCKEILSLFLPLTEATIARILGTVVRTHAGLEDNAFSSFLSAVGGNSFPDIPHLKSWDVSVLVETIKELAPDTNWVGVMENLDHEGFYVPNENAFTFFMTIYRRACQDSFPLHAICGSVWKNSEGQLSFLKYAVSANPELFTFAHSSRQLVYVDAVHGLTFQPGQSNHAWVCLDLLDVLCQLAEMGHAATIQSMLEYPLEHCPEILLLGVAQIHTTYNLLQHEVSSIVLPMIIANAGRKGVILHLWHINPSLVLRGFVDVLANDSVNMQRIVDICQESKILNHVLERMPFSFAIKVAAFASEKEHIDLERWLCDNLTTSKDVFLKECLKYLKEFQSRTASEESTNRLHQTASFVNLSSRSALVILKVLQANAHTVIPNSSCDDIEKLHISLMNSGFGQQNDGVNDSTSSNSHPDDVETEANSYFQLMFSERLLIDEMVEMLGRFKESSDKREQSIFECMISNLFEEYRFFPKYPERQLGIAAVLFGSIIKHQLVFHLTLGMALRCVLDALRKPADSKMFVFGTKALEKFVNRLDEWPQYCNHILQISHIRGTHPELVSYIEGVLARKSHGGNGPVDQLNMSSLGTPSNEINMSATSQPGKSFSSPISIQPRPSVLVDDVNKTVIQSSTKPFVPTSAQPTTASLSDAVSVPKIPSLLSTSTPIRNPGVTNARFGSAMNIGTLLAAAEQRDPVEAPLSEVQDKIMFIFNNVASNNMEAKAKEFLETLKEECYPWFAEYMVMRRASIEHNFHEMYLKFLEKVNSKALYKEIVKATYVNCKVLLGSELIKSSSEERSLLKNLGTWLGRLTIGRNQVLRARDIDPKSLIIEAYEKGLMIAIIPFTSKILEPCQSSLAYQPPNPWTMAILALLSEIYAMPNLKMNLRFDIEVLFKNLGVQIKDVTPSSLLKDRLRVVEGNPDFSNKDLGAPQPPITEDSAAIPDSIEPTKRQLPVQISSYAPPEDDKVGSMGFSDQLPSGQGLLQPQLSSSIHSLGVQVIVNSKLNALGLHVHFQRVLPLAMDRAIKEIVPGIVQRSVSIATQTTKELVIKDYALESEEGRIYSAAHLMVASLAGSLAHVTCKEPLRGSISTQLRSMLQGVNIGSEILEQYVQLVTNDNLDLGCAIIEKAATDKAVQTIDAEIRQQLSLRRKHRESLGSSMYDGSIYAQNSMAVLPETLRPTPGRLSITQQRVYEDFVRLPWQNQQSSQSANNSLSAHSPSPSPSGGSFPHTFNAASGPLSVNAYSSGLGNTSFGVGSQPIDLVPEEMNPTSTQLLSTAALSHIRTSDSISETDSILVSSSGAPTVESQPAESTATIRDSGMTTQPLSVGSSSGGTALSEPSLTTGEAVDKYQIVALKLETALANDGREAEIQSIVLEIPQIILRCVSRDEAALAIAQKVFKSLYEIGSNSLHIAAHLASLGAIRDVCKLVVKELTGWVIYLDEERKFNKHITVGLIRRELLNLAEYDIHMAKLLDEGRNKVATDYSLALLQTLMNEEPKVISELQNLVEAVAKLATRPGSPELLQQLVETVKNPASAVSGFTSFSSGKDDKNRQAREKKVSQSMASRGDFNNEEDMDHDASSFQKKFSLLFADWYRVCEAPGGNDTQSKFILKLYHNGLLRGDDITDHFFRVLLEISVSHFSEVMQSSQQVFLAIDIYAKLVYSILKHCPLDQGSSKLFLLTKVLAVTVRSIQRDADERKEDFNPRPYYRLFINWLLDFGSLDPVHEVFNFQVLSAFANAFHALQPLKVPAFSFAWLELVSHRTFMPKLLAVNSQKGWPFLHRLLVDLFQFMEPFLRNAEMGDLIRFLYKGTLRVLLVLLHDFPEFLCDYHFSFCDVIPPSCIQMRNIILSAFPRNMRLPDPSTPNLKIDLLDEMSQAPRILSEVDAALKAKQMKADVDEFLNTMQQSSTFLSELKQRLVLSTNEASLAGTCYNVPLINSLVLYVGMQAIQLLQARNRTQPQSVNSGPLGVKAALDIFQTLIRDLDTEGRYLFLNAIANQLRYPNTHTHYFSVILLYLFSDAHQEIIQEQITRVLLERLIVNRPHPWGLLITFIELIKNPGYNFWIRSFTRCAPEIEKLFESVSRSCGGPKPVNENMVGSGGLTDNAH